MNLKSYIHNFSNINGRIICNIYHSNNDVFHMLYKKRVYVFNYNLINLARNTDKPTIRAIINELINGT